MMEDLNTAVVVAASRVEDPWVTAKERYLSDLSEDERVLFNEATIENLCKYILGSILLSW